MHFNGIDPSYYTDGLRPRGPKPPVPPRIDDGPGMRTAETTFSDDFRDALGRLNEAELTADAATRELATGQSDDVLGAVMAAEKASLAMNTALRIRSDVLDAYEQIIRMPL